MSHTENPYESLDYDRPTGCVVDGCGLTLVARSMCRKHYVAWHRKTPVDHRVRALGLRRSPRERFEEKFHRVGPNDCWIWQGSRTRGGHGEFHVSRLRGRVPAHVFAVELATGIPCPPDKEGCHHCDNPPCVNPTHIYYGTRQQNVNDMWARNRGRRGEASSSAKLKESEVLAIRTRFAAGSTQPDLAAEFGISDSQVSYIVNGLEWTHVGGPIRTHGRPGRRPKRKAS